MQNVTDEERVIVEQALAILARSVHPGAQLSSPRQVLDFLRLEMGWEPNEHFSMVFLDSQHRVLSYKRLFHGTINSATVYPRVIAQEALACNALVVIAVHNHPSGCVEPSRADMALTDKMVDALSLLDIRLLDHFIVGPSEFHYSFAESGLL